MAEEELMGQIKATAPARSCHLMPVGAAATGNVDGRRPLQSPGP
ncbi:hypothetical protein [Micromonospora chersina]